jgi:hypothetical protein
MKKVFLVFVALLSFATTAFAQLGSLDQDLVYIPITPCRIFDTRPSEGGTGSIPALGTRSFVLSSVTTYGPQGGANSNCGVIDGFNVAAAVVNMTVVSRSAGGYITAFPSGTVKPLAATVNYGANDVRGNLSVVKVNQTTPLSLSIYTSSEVDVIGDITGYYSRPRSVNLNCSNPPEATLLVAPGDLGRLAIPACAAINSYGGGSSTPYCSTDGLDMVTYGGSGVCAMKNMGSASATITAGRRCCGVPGGRAYP